MQVMPTLKQLYYLSMLAEHLNFRRAADACYVTQSTLSAAIKELEAILGVELVDRRGRQICLTPAGEVVMRRGDKLLREARDLQQAAMAAEKPLAGTWRLGVIPTIAPWFLPGLVSLVAEEFPDIDLKIREGLTHELEHALDQGEIDAALLALPWPIEGLACEMVAADGFMFVEPGSDGATAPVSLAQVTGEDRPFLMLGDGHCLRDHALAVCGTDKAGPDLVFSSLTTLVQMVCANKGVTLLPELAVERGLLAGLPVTARRVSDDGAKRDIALVWDPSSPRDSDNRVLATGFRKLFPVSA